jgi:IclR family acetate operon transcriptional repressor
LTILEAVAKSREPVGIGKLRELLGINRRSVIRLTNTLHRRGFLSSPNGRNEYIVDLLFGDYSKITTGIRSSPSARI